MWCDTVGCDSPTGSVRSHTHISPSLLPTIIAMSLTRVGSPSALNTCARCCERESSSAASFAGAQHVRAQDAAADAARLLGRGESDARALALLRRALPGATLEAARTDGLVCVTVRAPARLVLTLPVAEVRGSSCALDDELAGVPPND